MKQETCPSQQLWVAPTRWVHITNTTVHCSLKKSHGIPAKMQSATWMDHGGFKKLDSGTKSTIQTLTLISARPFWITQKCSHAIPAFLRVCCRCRRRSATKFYTGTTAKSKVNTSIASTQRTTSSTSGKNPMQSSGRTISRCGQEKTGECSTPTLHTCLRKPWSRTLWGITTGSRLYVSKRS